MTALFNRVVLFAACCAPVPAAATLADPTQLDAVSAYQNTSYNDPDGVGPLGNAYGFHYGVGAVTSSRTRAVVPPTNPPTFVAQQVASASVSIAGFPYLELSATNPTNIAGSTYAHAELSYQYLLTVANTLNLTPLLNTTFENVATITGISHIHTEGLSTSLSLVASAPGNNSFNPITARYADGSDDTAYIHDYGFTLYAPGEFVGTTTVNGVDFLNYKGTLSLYATVFGVTNSHTIIVDGHPETVTINNHPGATGFASLDPLISFNLAFLTQNGLSGGTVTLSQGVANASGPSGAPEPGSWALLLVGFGLTGAMVRRKAIHKHA